MTQNVVVCCDGTANEFAKDRTNVVKLYFTLVDDPTRQLNYYHPGVGTMEPPGALTRYSRAVTKWAGQAIGWGLESDIRDAYAFIMNHFSPGDNLFLFGFSRGAYTVRAVASLLKMYGLMRPGNEAMIRYAIRMMMAITNLNKGNAGTQPRAVDDYFNLAAEFRSTYSKTVCAPYFVGVWDTVSSVGWIENPVHLPYSADNGDIQIGRHAIAIDEHRAFFRTNLWRPHLGGGPKDLKQVWFAGVHCDVGGGYPEAESGLSKIALEWMLREAKQAGLLTEPDREKLQLGYGNDKYVRPDPKAQMHQSLKGFWNLAEFVPKKHYDWDSGKEKRRMNLYRRRTIPEGAMIHASAFERGQQYTMKFPASAISVS
jgi:uncharacterized protein (DUF2235 family)